MKLRDAFLDVAHVPLGPLPGIGSSRKAARSSVGRDDLLNLLEVTLQPLVLVVSFWAISYVVEGALSAPEMLLALVVFSLTFPSPPLLSLAPMAAVRRIIIAWITLAGLLFFLGYATHYLDYFRRDTLIAWAWIAPSCQIAAHFLMRLSAPAIHSLAGAQKRAVIAGMNKTGVELARRLEGGLYSPVEVMGFVDDRVRERLPASDTYDVLGKIDQLPELVKSNRVDIVYLALPMVSQQRILSLLDALRDTTASVYFAPDMFVTELIQGRIDSVSGMPVVGVCDTPFTGTDGLIKRGSDIVLSLLILAVIAPLLFALALAVKLSSPGPVIFRQRRYGLDGREITVYKFRTMRVREDGEEIRQCSRGDPRVTPLGAFMRRTSLDELPQFLNVLQGRMSIVGPRPHAVAHNETYRKLIKGYMQRHKVRPGITGWAQVNGLRGETESLDKMRARVEHDLDYLRRWSLPFDLYIIGRTVWAVLKGHNAY